MLVIAMATHHPLIWHCPILHTLKDEFEGMVKLVFQPAEEKAPGGASLINRSAQYRQHVAPNIQGGKIGF